MNWVKWEDLAKAFVSTVFVIFTVWQYVAPVDQTMVMQVVTWIFALLAALVGTNAIRRLFTGKELKEGSLSLSKASVGNMSVERWFDTVKALVSFAFVALNMLGIISPVSEDLVMNFLQYAFAIAAAIIGALATQRIANKKIQVVVRSK